MATRRVGSNRLPLLVGGEALRVAAERPRGRPGKFHPQSIELARQRLGPQVERLFANIRDLPAERRADKVVFQATLLPNYWASSYFPQELLDEAGLSLVGTRVATAPYETKQSPPEDRDAKSLLVAGNNDAIANLSQFVSGARDPQRQAAQDQIREFFEFRLPFATEVVKVTDRDDPDEEILCEAVLHPDLGPQDDVYRKWLQWVHLLDGSVDEGRVRTVGSLLFVPARLRERVLDRVALFNPLRVIRRSPRLRPLRPTRARAALAPAQALPWHVEARSEYRIAIFDGGADETDPIVRPFVRNIDLTPEPVDPDDLEHGTVVTTTALFGAVTPGQVLPTPPAYLDHYRVLPVPPAEDDYDASWILDRIVETLEAHQYPIVGLSLGPDLAIDDGEPHRWTAELDRLAKERGILFVVAAGNNGENDAAAGLNRVLVPSDVVNGVAVGASASPDGDVARATFSPVGPGRPGGRVRPTGLSFGGNLPAFSQLWIGPQGSWIDRDGTSFSAPRVVHGLAGLLASNVRAVNSLNTLRAFAVHFSAPSAENCPGPEVGYGRLPDDYDSHLACDPQEVTVLYEDRIERDEVAGYVLPIPVGLGRARLDIRWTLVITAPTNPSDGAEYSQAGLEVFFRPHSQMYEFWRGQDRLGQVNVNDQADRAAELIRAGGVQSPNPVVGVYERRRLREEALRDSGKWETIVSARRGARTESLHEARLDVAYLARSGGLLNAQQVDALDVSLIVSIRARRGLDVYSRVRAQFPQLVPAAQASVPISAT